MILGDTSVWIDHLRAGDAGLVMLLENAEVLSHPEVDLIRSRISQLKEQLR